MRHYDGEHADDANSVRPYTVTGGRTRSHTADLPLEALVRTAGTSDVKTSSERRRILELAADQVLSVAELSAHLHLPLGVVRVLVGDLASDGLVVIHGGSVPSFGITVPPATNLKVLESVLNGISAL
jgi:hypothetical protein